MLYNWTRYPDNRTQMEILFTIFTTLYIVLYTHIYTYVYMYMSAYITKTKQCGNCDSWLTLWVENSLLPLPSTAKALKNAEYTLNQLHQKQNVANKFNCIYKLCRAVYSLKCHNRKIGNSRCLNDLNDCIYSQISKTDAAEISIYTMRISQRNVNNSAEDDPRQTSKNIYSEI